MVKKQGICSKAVRTIPAPTGTANRFWSKDIRAMYTAKNSTDMIRATFLNTARSLPLSFLASLSMGLQKKTWSVDARARQVNMISRCSSITSRIKNKKAESSRVEDTKHTPGDCK